jgi:transposase-like protein
MRKTKDGRRKFTQKFKIAAVKRVERGERQADVARDLGVAIPLLARWRQRVRVSGGSGLRQMGRPVGSKQQETTSEARRIAGLEQLVGRQQAAIDFLEQALHQVEELRRPKNGAGAKASSR